jgi:hypothetical protein
MKHQIRKNENGQQATPLKAREIRPDRIIPLEDEDFQSF